MEFGTDLLDDIVIIFIAAAVGGLAARLIRLPPLIGYLVVGAVVGPQALGLVTNITDVQTLAELGVILLLFAVGVEISIAELRQVGWRVLVAGGGQIVLTVGIGYGIGAALGWSPRQSLAAGMVLSLSSTMVALKTLNDRGEVGALHGRVATGILIMQDLAFVPMIAILVALGDESGSLAAGLALSALKAALVLGAVLLIGGFAATRVLKRIAFVGARESFIITVVAATLATAALTEWAGLSAALGAFLAGLVLSESDWAGKRALSEVIPVRDIFAALFFVSLGMLADAQFLVDHVWEVVLFIAAAIIAKMVLTTALTRALGYLPSTSLRTGLFMVQIGEFSFIIAGTAVAIGIADSTLLPLTIMAAVVTMGLTPGIAGAGSRVLDALQTKSSRWGRYLNGKDPTESASVDTALRGHVVIAGYGRVGSFIAAELDRLGTPHVVIDFDPARMNQRVGAYGNLLYGDAANEAMLKVAGIQNARLFIVALPDPVSTIVAVQCARRLNPSMQIVGRAGRDQEVHALRETGADAVVWPELEAAIEMMRISLQDIGVAEPELMELVDEARVELGEIGLEEEDR